MADMISANDQNNLEQVCQAAHRRARAEGKPVMVSFAFQRKAGDLLPFAENVGEDESFRAYWEHPSDDFAMVAGGVAQRFCAKGKGRFKEMARKIEPMLHTALSAGSANSGPYVLGGFSFFDDIDDAEWPGFNAAQMVVPGWMMLRRHGAVTAMVNRMAAPHEAPQFLAAEIAEKVRMLANLPVRRRWKKAMEPLASLNRLLKQLQGAEGRRHWRKMVSNALAEIRAGRLSKVVLARTFDVLSDKMRSPLPILRHLRKAYPACFNFFVNPGAGQVFLGATPEQLVRYENGRVFLGALAGTTSRGGNAKEDRALARRLLASGKERGEHQIVVDAILKSISGLGEIQRPPEPSVVKLSNLQHLYTPITLRATRPLSIFSMIERLHPTPAVGGHPNPVALERIRRLENFERGWYAAPVGWMNARGEGEFAVALRACTLNAERVRLFAGGGIVAESDAEEEFLEIELKLRPILSAIANA
ncbi:MAG: isochorismate synthase [SAR324 cluster bacterium]|nr:isochorismate synthase [SAR324 cluster bacterium]